MNTKNTTTKDHELLNNLLYIIFAVNLIIHKKIELTTNPYSSDNDRNKHNQNIYNDRYRNNDRYRSNSREYSLNNYRSNS